MLTATAWRSYKSLIHQYFRTIAEPRAEVNRDDFRLLAPCTQEIHQFQFTHERPQISGVRHIPPGQAGIPAFFDLPLEWAAKVESAGARCDCPQSGQAIGSPSRRTSFSNLVPQSSQTYSKIGILMVSEPWQLEFYFSAERGAVLGRRKDGFENRRESHRGLGER